MPGHGSTPSTDRARAAVAEVAAGLGLRFDNAIPLRDGSNLIVWLEPAPVIARAATATALARRGDAWLRREVGIARHLADAGAPVVAPATEIPPGPHTHDGVVMSFWALAMQAEALDATAAGRGLREIHELLADAPRELYDGFSPLGEARAILADPGVPLALAAPERARLGAEADALAARVAALRESVRPVHGDAHLGNVLQTASGPLWNDWEDTHLAPVEWDLACLHAATRFGAEPGAVAEAQRAHGGAIESPAFAAMYEARVLQGTVWRALSAARGRARTHSPG